MRARTAALALAAASLACDPASTRPVLTPMPEAQHAETRNVPAKAIDLLARALQADSIPIRRIERRDTWLDSGWFDATTLAPVGRSAIGVQAVRVRAWVDRGRPKYSDLTVEAVYRGAVDPSQPSREEERPLPKDHPVMARIKRVLEALGERPGIKDVT